MKYSIWLHKEDNADVFTTQAGVDIPVFVDGQQQHKDNTLLKVFEASSTEEAFAYADKFLDGYERS